MAGGELVMTRKLMTQAGINSKWKMKWSWKASATKQHMYVAVVESVTTDYLALHFTHGDDTSSHEGSLSPLSTDSTTVRGHFPDPRVLYWSISQYHDGRTASEDEARSDGPPPTTSLSKLGAPVEEVESSNTESGAPTVQAVTDPNPAMGGPDAQELTSHRPEEVMNRCTETGTPAMQAVEDWNNTLNQSADKELDEDEWTLEELIEHSDASGIPHHEARDDEVQSEDLEALAANEQQLDYDDLESLSDTSDTAPRQKGRSNKYADRIGRHSDLLASLALKEDEPTPNLNPLQLRIAESLLRAKWDERSHLEKRRTSSGYQERQVALIGILFRIDWSDATNPVLECRPVSSRHQMFSKLATSRHWCPSTCAGRWRMCLGILKALRLEVHADDKTLAKLLAQDAKEDRVIARDFLRIEDLRVLRAWIDPEARLLLDLTFFLGQRLSDVMRVRAGGIFSVNSPDGQLTAVTFTSTKTQTDPYALHVPEMTLGTRLSTHIEKWSLTANDVLFLDKNYTAISNAIKRLKTQQNRPELSVVSLRRGGLTHWALKKASVGLLLRLSRHTTEKMLMTYLGHGAYLTTHATELVNLAMLYPIE